MEASTEKPTVLRRLVRRTSQSFTWKLVEGIGLKYILITLLLIVVIIGLVMVAIFSILFLGLSSSSHSDLSLQKQWEVSTDFPSVAKTYLPIYQAAGKKYGVPWNILAAIHKVETDFGRNLSVSPVGARGQAQFMPKTWVGWSYPGGSRLGDLPDNVNITDPAVIARYGGYGVDANGDGTADPNDPADAIYATAKYLAANHHPGEDWFAPKGAIWQYNHDYEHYVLKVKMFAEAFARPVLTVQRSVVATGQFMWPVTGGKLTSPFGLRFHPLEKIMKVHEGIDIGKSLGAPILASDGGRVIQSQVSSGYGWIIVIDHGNGYQTLYAHMYEKDVKVRVGQIVAKGEVIGLMGSNGWSTGPHLHFEVHRNGEIIDPQAVLKSP